MTEGSEKMITDAELEQIEITLDRLGNLGADQVGAEPILRMIDEIRRLRSRPESVCVRCASSIGLTCGEDTVRDPRVDPQVNDVLLTPEGPLVVGGVTDDGEVLWGCGDSRYYYTAIAQWRERMVQATVLHIAQFVSNLPVLPVREGGAGEGGEK